MTHAKTIIAGVLLLVTGAIGAAFIAWRVPDQPVSALQAKWAPPPSQFIAVRGMQVHVRDEGPRDDVVPIVLLHGTGASLHTWDGWTRDLTNERRVIRFDLPGFGLTGPSPDGVYSIESYVDTVLAVVDTLGVQRFILAERSAATSRGPPPSCIQSASSAWSWSTQPATRSSRNPCRSPFGSRARRSQRAHARRPAPRCRRKQPARRLRRPDQGDARPRRSVHRSRLARGNRAALVARFDQTKPGSLVERVPEIQVPTLILWGGKDRLIPLELGERFARDIRGSRLVVFDALGHVPHEEDPAHTVEAVLPFIRAAGC